MFHLMALSNECRFSKEKLHKYVLNLVEVTFNLIKYMEGQSLSISGGELICPGVA